MTDIPKNLSGKAAVVTGAGSGIGKAAALLLAEAGARLALIDRTLPDLEETAAALAAISGGHLTLQADVGDEGQMKSAFQCIGDNFAALDVAVANAGINGIWAPLAEIEVQEWDKTLGVNLRGTFLTVKLALPFLRKAGGGSVIVVSSINGTRVFSNSGATAYSCSKAAQVAFTKMTALELARDRIRVNAVCPGAIQTNIEDSTDRKDVENLRLPVVFPEGDVPLTDGEPGSAEQVARLIWFLAGDLSSHITGTEIYIEGGQSLLQG